MILRLIVTALMLVTTVSLSEADTLAGRFGFTGKAGIVVPLENDFIKDTSETKNSFSAAAGMIFGMGDHFAAEIELAHVPNLEVYQNGVNGYEARLVDVSLGLQYRLMPNSSVVPYIGAGFDAVRGGLYIGNTSYTLDWTYGGHINAGLDWFLTRGIALTAEVRGVQASKGDIKRSSVKVGEYDPSWVQGMVGVRLLLPEKF